MGNWLRKVFIDDALSVCALLCWTKFGKYVASDFFEPKLEKQGKNPKFPHAFGGECKADFSHFVAALCSTYSDRNG